MGQSFSRRTPSRKEARLSHDVEETHRALLSDDVVFLTLSNFAHWDGSKAAVVCTVWQSQWKLVRRCAGMLQPAGHRVGAFKFCKHVVANPGGGVIVSDYQESRLVRFSPEGEFQGAFAEGPVYTPGAVALLGAEPLSLGLRDALAKQGELARRDLLGVAALLIPLPSLV